MSPPSLTFRRRWKQIHQGKDVKQMYSNVKMLRCENTVLHMCTIRDPEATEERIRYGMSVNSDEEPTNNRKVWKESELQVLSNTDLDSPFMHLCFYLHNLNGKILRFRRNKNLIRAGKYTSSESVLSVMRFNIFTNSDYHTGLAVPNSVVSGKFKKYLKEDIKSDPHVSDSRKFPGASVNLSDPETRCTPEIYTGWNKRLKKRRTSTFIMPGFRSVDDLAKYTQEVNSLSTKYILKEDDQL
jgi:hypothetical protein